MPNWNAYDNIRIKGPVPWIDVTHPDYGAKGDGVTDDTTAIQNALNAALAGGSAEILFPGAGPYIINSPLVVPLTATAGVSAIRGTAGVNGTVIKAGASFPATGGILRNSSATQIEGLRIENIQFDANNKAQYALDLSQFKMPVLYNVRATRATSHGIFTGGVPDTQGPVMFYVFSYLNAGAGYYFSGGGGIFGFNTTASTNTLQGMVLSATESAFIGSQFDLNGGTGLQVLGGSRHSFVGGWVGNNGFTPMSGQQIYIGSNASGVDVIGMQVISETASASALYAIAVADTASYVNIIGNNIEFSTNSTSKRCIQIGTASGSITGVHVSGNTLRVVNGDAISMEDNSGADTLSGISIGANTYSANRKLVLPSSAANYPTEGVVLRNVGATASVADGGTITHGLAVTPRWARVQTSVASQFASVTAISATTITVAIKTDAGAAGTTQTIYWEVGL